MDPELRGIIFDGDVYFTDKPLDLPFKVLFAKKVYSQTHNRWNFYVIDSNYQAKIIFEDDGLKIQSMSEEIKVIDIAIKGVEIFLLSGEGDLYFRNESSDDLIAINRGTKFKHINSGFRGELIAIDVNGNIWTDNPYIISNNYSFEDEDDEKLIQCTSGFNFIQVEFSDDNIVCLDSEGSLYIVGNNSLNELCCMTEKIERLTKVISDVKFRKIAKSAHFTALIDFDNGLWMCGNTPFVHLKPFYRPHLETEKDRLLRKVLLDVKDISVGPLYIIAQLLDDSIKIATRKAWPNENYYIDHRHFYTVNGMIADKLFNNMTQ